MATTDTSTTKTNAPDLYQGTPPQTGEEHAEAKTEQERLDYEAVQEALAPTQDADYGPEPIALESNPPVEEANEIVNDHTEAVESADESDNGLSKGGNQAAPSYQPPVTTIQDGDNLDDPEARIDPATADSDDQKKAAKKDKKAKDDEPAAQPA